MTESVQLTRQNKSERKAIKNARQRRQRMIEGAFDRLHGVGQMYDCKVYMVLQTPEGQFKTYSNTKGQNWPPSRHQISCLSGVERRGPESYGAHQEPHPAGRRRKMPESLDSSCSESQVPLYNASAIGPSSGSLGVTACENLNAFDSLFSQCLPDYLLPLPLTSTDDVTTARS